MDKMIGVVNGVEIVVRKVVEGGDRMDQMYVACGCGLWGSVEGKEWIAERIESLEKEYKEASGEWIETDVKCGTCEKQIAVAFE